VSDTTDKFEHIPFLKAGFVEWPHEFNRLMRNNPKVPPSFWITLLHLWSATVGSRSHKWGRISFSAIPVRSKSARKFIAALCEAGFFWCTAGRYGGHTESTRYQIQPDKMLVDWERFLDALSWAIHFGGLEDDVPTRKFGKLVGQAAKQSVDPMQDSVRKLFRKT